MVPTDVRRRADCLLALQVTTRSVLGGLAWHSGGVLLDHGWLRLLGGASVVGAPDLVSVKGPMHGRADFSDYVAVAVDVVGGCFAINGGALPGPLGEVAYFAPDTLQWQPLGLSHRDWVHWALTGPTDEFYADLRWPGWQDESSQVPPASLLSTFPFLWSAPARREPETVSRRAVAWREVLEIQQEMATATADLPDGAVVRVVIDQERQKRRWRR